mgnify:CR=1 FL=1
MNTTITEIEKFEEFLGEFNFFEEAQIDEDSIKSDAVEFEIRLLCPLKDTPENCKVYDKFLFFTLEKHAYISVLMTFYNIKNSEIILNRDEHDEPIYISMTNLDFKEKSIRFVFEHDKVKHIKLDYTNFKVDISYDENDKTYAHKRLKFRPMNTLKEIFK